jgi:hypothetical protein
MSKKAVRASCPRAAAELRVFSRGAGAASDEIASGQTITYHQSLEGVVDELHFEGDPAIDSTRRRLERVMKAGEPRSEWKWMAALAAGAGALIFWQVKRRRRNGNGHDSSGEKRLPA